METKQMVSKSNNKMMTKELNIKTVHKLYLVTLLLMFVFAYTSNVSAAVRSSTNYQIEQDIISSGAVDSSSTNYQLVATLGQPIVGAASSTSYSLISGFIPLDTGSLDSDGDGTPDNVDTDDDNDGMTDTYETANGLDPLDATGVNGASGDLDGDGLSNIDEFNAGTAANFANFEGAWSGTQVSTGTNCNEFPNFSSDLYAGFRRTGNTLEVIALGLGDNVTTFPYGFYLATYNSVIDNVATGTYILNNNTNTGTGTLEATLNGDSISITSTGISPVDTNPSCVVTTTATLTRGSPNVAVEPLVDGSRSFIGTEAVSIHDCTDPSNNAVLIGSYSSNLTLSSGSLTGTSVDGAISDTSSLSGTLDATYMDRITGTLTTAGGYNGTLDLTIQDIYLSSFTTGTNPVLPAGCLVTGVAIGTEDADGDNIPDSIDTDDDNDGISDDYETANGLDPLDATGVNGASGDLDGDGLSNIDEFNAGTAANFANFEGAWSGTQVSTGTDCNEFPDFSSDIYLGIRRTGNTLESIALGLGDNVTTFPYGFYLGTYDSIIDNVATGTYILNNNTNTGTGTLEATLNGDTLTITSIGISPLDTNHPSCVVTATTTLTRGSQNVAVEPLVDGSSSFIGTEAVSIHDCTDPSNNAVLIGSYSSNLTLSSGSLTGTSVDGAISDTSSLSGTLDATYMDRITGTLTTAGGYNGTLDLTIQNGNLSSFTTGSNPVLPAGCLVTGVALGNSGVAENDFDGDGKSDILWRNDSGLVYIWYMDGTTIVSDGSVFNLSSDWHYQDTGDFNGDGQADILWRNDSGLIYIWYMDGTTISGGGEVFTLTNDWQLQGVGDFDGDGKSDILWRNTSGLVYIWYMDGTTIVSDGSVFNLSSDWTYQDIGDFNGDGQADILWRNDNGQIYIWYMDGTTISGGGEVFTLTNDWQIQGVADFDGDGKSDILWRNTSGLVYIWYLDGTTIVSDGSVFDLSSDWTYQDMGDYNGDGQADILWRNDSGQIYIWYMDGTTISGGGAVFTLTPDWKVAPKSP
jgi:FG-GAP-like repeat